MSEIPSQQRALLLESKQAELVVGHSAIPKPGPGQLLVKIKATALNPADWKIHKYGLFIEKFPAILGLDFSGDVLTIGQGVTNFEVGDKVIGLGNLFDDTINAFQEYTLANANYTSKIPSNITYDQGATLPLGVATAYLGMYNTAPCGMGLVSPLEASGPGHYKGSPIFVTGGASSVAQAVLQFAKLSGFSPIITTASLKHTDYLKSLGATHVLDRNLSDSDLESEIRKITRRPIEYVYDAISSSETQNTGVRILSPGGTLLVVDGGTITATDKQVFRLIVSPGVDHDTAALTTLYGNLTELVENGLIRPNRLELLPNGLVGVIEGLKRMEENKVSGIKLVARPEETPA